MSQKPVRNFKSQGKGLQEQVAQLQRALKHLENEVTRCHTTIFQLRQDNRELQRRLDEHTTQEKQEETP